MGSTGPTSLPGKSLSLIASTLLGLGACNGDVTLPGDQWPVVFRAISGDQQSGTVDSPLPAPLIVEAADGGGRPVPGAAIVFRFDAGVSDGQLDPDTAVTDADGRASVTVRLGSPVGAQHVVGRATQATSNDVTVRFTLNAAEPPRPPAPPRDDGGGGGNGGGGGGGNGGGGRNDGNGGNSGHGGNGGGGHADGGGGGGSSDGGGGGGDDVGGGHGHDDGGDGTATDTVMATEILNDGRPDAVRNDSVGADSVVVSGGWSERSFDSNWEVLWGPPAG